MVYNEERILKKCGQSNFFCLIWIIDWQENFHYIEVKKSSIFIIFYETNICMVFFIQKICYSNLKTAIKRNMSKMEKKSQNTLIWCDLNRLVSTPFDNKPFSHFFCCIVTYLASWCNRWNHLYSIHKYEIHLIPKTDI